jgi:hypothetical protein
MVREMRYYPKSRHKPPLSSDNFMPRLWTKLIETANAIGGAVVLILLLPFLLLWGFLWLLRGTFIIFGLLSIIFVPMAFLFWGWSRDHWLGVVIAMSYAIVYLGWRSLGDQVTAFLRYRGWLKSPKEWRHTLFGNGLKGRARRWTRTERKRSRNAISSERTI